MKSCRFLAVGIVLLAMVVLLVVPVLGKTIDNSSPFGFERAPGLDGRAEFVTREISAGNSGNVVLVDPIHICGSGRGG